MEYSKTIWVDNIKDIDTGETIQQGTPVSARNLNNMENGIDAANKLAEQNKSNLTSIAVEVATLKNASLNNLTNNVFFENFDNLTGIEITNGIYDKVGKRLYA